MDTDYLMGKLEIRCTNGEADTEMSRQGRQEWGKVGLQGRAGEVESLGKAECDGEVEGKVPEEVKVEELADDEGSGSPGGRH